MTAKAKVESAVQIVVEREILAPLRQEHFTSLAKVNYALAYARKQVNNRSFQKLAGSRRSVFEELERAALRPLLPTRYGLAMWMMAKVNIDYHVAVEKHFYGVPYALVCAKVDVRLTATAVEILHGGNRVAAHARSTVTGWYTTDPGHRPKSHQQHREWLPSRLIRWGKEIGPHRPSGRDDPRAVSASGARAIARASRSSHSAGATVVPGSKRLPRVPSQPRM